MPDIPLGFSGIHQVATIPAVSFMTYDAVNIQSFNATIPPSVALNLVQDAGIYAGKSAYQVAVDNGFIGTEAQWLDYLAGGNFTADPLAYYILAKS